MLILRRTGMSCSACACSDMDIHGSDNKVRFGFQIRDSAGFLVAYCCGILNAYMYPGLNDNVFLVFRISENKCQYIRKTIVFLSF